MDSIAALQPGMILSNKQLSEIFQCSTQRGMRRSLRTGTLVIVTNHVDSIYEDRWEGDILHYTGMGQIGDMRLDYDQNRTLHESLANNVAIHLFEVFRKNEYTYAGEVERSDEPYQATQPDAQGNIRLAWAWLFPLRMKFHKAPAINSEKAREAYLRHEKRVARLSDEELKKRAVNAPTKPGSRPAVAMQYARSPEVSEYAKRRAKGYCELCKAPAPFATQRGEPYLECHHIEWLARGGEDTIENTVALCPNCHRKMHLVDSQADRAHLKTVIEKS